MKDNDNGYRTPLSGYWGKFKEAYYVMASEHIELGRMAKDTRAHAIVEKLRAFAVTPAVSQAYNHMVSEFDGSDSDKIKLQRLELVAIAQQEQLNVLQPLIYDDALLRITMDTNHRFSRLTNGWLSPKFKVIYRASSQNSDPELETVFDAPASVLERFTGEIQSLPNSTHRMEFVTRIASQFNRLMVTRRPYMEAELQKILQWKDA